MTATEFLVQRQRKLIVYYSVFGIISLLIFSLRNVILGDYLLGLLELVFGIIGIVNLLYLRARNHVEEAAFVILVLMLIIGGVFLWRGGVANTGVYWMFTLPLLAYSLLSVQKARVFAALQLSTVFMFMALAVFWQSVSVYGIEELFQLFVSMFVLTGMMHVYATVLSHQETHISERTSSLRQEIDEKAESAQQIKSLLDKQQRQIQELSDAKRAMLNLLEDVNQEREATKAAVDELEKFQLAVENGSDQIVITDPDGQILYANPSTQKISGFSPDELVGKKAGSSKLWGGVMDKAFYERMWHTLKVDKQTFVGELQNRRKDGREYTAEVHIDPVLNEKREIKYFVSIERDISKAKEIDRMKTEFISLASHQLRTPLSAMRWFLEMLINGDIGELSPEQKDIITDINTSNNRMIDFVSSLLNISGIESGAVVIDQQKTNVPELIRSILNELQMKLDQKHLKFEQYIPEDLPPIRSEQKMLMQVYLNLLSNAIKYTPEYGTIKLSVYEEGDMIVSKVEDTGYGIPESDKDRIFEKFFRSDNIRKHVTDGIGLGLYFVKRVVESLGGKIGFESQEDHGSTFWFSLPKSGSLPRGKDVFL